VVVYATVGTDGEVKEAQGVLAPSELQAEAARDAVLHWVYKPSRFSGQPVEVETTINVVSSPARGGR
jgi:hypothetical protein